MKKRVLIVTPKFPYPSYGACELDRAAGIEIFVKLGYEVYLITKVYGEEFKQEAGKMAEKLGITIVPVTYKYLLGAQSFFKKMQSIFSRFFRPWYFDGAAYEYCEPEIRQAVQYALDSFKPELVWFDYTYLWPLYSLVKKRGLPIITRSINFEPLHFLEEDGRTFGNYLKFIPKLLSEYLTVRKSALVLAITPQEAEIYKKIGARRVVVLPLRGLPHCLDQKSVVVRRKPLNVFFSGSTYNVVHNRKALEFLLTEIIPLAHKTFPGEFRFHIFGGKVPQQFYQYFGTEVIKYNYLSTDKFVSLMSEMDIAVVPSLYGAGMQQKIFEPLTRGIPTITSSRGLAGYPFYDCEHLLLANSADQFVECLDRLRNEQVRQSLGAASREVAQRLFSVEAIRKIIVGAISFSI